MIDDSWKEDIYVDRWLVGIIWIMIGTEWQMRNIDS